MEHREPPPGVEPSSPDELASHEGLRRERSDRPLARARRPSLVAGVGAVIVAGFALLGITLAAGPADGDVVVAAVVGLSIVALGAATLSGLLRPALAGAVALLGGVALAVAGLLPEPIELAEVGRLVAGAILFMAGAGILASSRAGRGGAT